MKARGLCFVVLVAGVLAAAGCASSSASPYGGYGYDGGNDYSYATQGPSARGDDYSQDQRTVAPASAAPNAPLTTGIPGQPEDRIIKTGTIDIQVSDVDESIARATDQIHALGGWLAGSNRTTTTAAALASVTYRVPANRFDEAVAAMRRLGTKVLSEHSESTSVGAQIVDLQARIDNLRASEKAIQSIMSQAKTIGDVLTVQERLADIQGQIEQLTAQKQGLTDQSAYSTLTVVFEVPFEPTPTASPSPTPSPEPTATPVAWSAGDQFNQAAGILAEAGKGGATLVIWLVVLVLPLSLALILLLVAAHLMARVVEPYRRRLLPFTVAEPYRSDAPRWPVPDQPAPGQPAPGPGQSQPPKA
jgi:hypothetical protein